MVMDILRKFYDCLFEFNKSKRTMRVFSSETINKHKVSKLKIKNSNHIIQDTDSRFGNLKICSLKQVLAYDLFELSNKSISK